MCIRDRSRHVLPRCQEAAYLLGDCLWFAIQPATCQTHDMEAVHKHFCIAGTIFLECLAAAVMYPAVRLDRELLLPPEGVDLASEHPGARLGQGQVVVATELDDPLLQP